MVFELIFWLVPQFYVSAVAIAIQGFFLGPLFPAAIVAATKLLPKHLHVSSIGFAAALGGAGAAVSLSQWELLPRRKVSRCCSHLHWLC
jgi:fucose permease